MASQFKHITVPRGTNVGHTIKSSFPFFDKVSILNIDLRRNVKDKAIDVHLEYKLN